MQPGQIFYLTEGKPFWIGKMPPSDLILTAEKVSSIHGFLFYHGKQFLFKDESRNGSFLNKEKVHQQSILLNHNDILDIGGTQFKVYHPGKTESVSLNERVLFPKHSSQLFRIGSYSNIQLLGSGAFGEVYKSIQRDSNQICALKLLKSFSVLGSIAKEANGRFFNEIHVLKKLQHPSITCIIDSGEFEINKEVRPYITFEFFHGSDLKKHVIQQGRFSWKEVVSILIQCLEAFQYMTEKGIIHRDIKPLNILYNPEIHRIQLIDFGIGKFLQEEEGQTEIQEHTVFVTQTGEILGTTNFMAAEQFQDFKRVDIRADIYSLGATAYYLLTEQVPYKNSNCAHILEFFGKLINNRLSLEPISQWVSDVPLELVLIITKMMEIQRANRYSTPKEVLDELELFKNSSDFS
ncbi:MAG: FHA domain-containing serine/threonine-protein kinase [Planctomycetota bacterium]